MNPQQQKQALITAAQQYAPPEATRTATAPQMGTITGPGGGVQPIQTNPLSPIGVGAVGPEIAQGIPLAQRSELTTNPVSGGLAVVNRGGNGQITGITNPPTQNVYNPSPGDREAIPGLTAERDAARNAYANAGTAHTNNQLVLAEHRQRCGDRRAGAEGAESL